MVFSLASTPIIFGSAPAAHTPQLTHVPSPAEAPRQFSNTETARPGTGEVDVNRIRSYEPAPMGIADYGMGPSGPYQYSTNESMGVVKIGSLQTRNSTGDPWMSFQLNVVLPFTSGTSPKVYWIQDVVQINTNTNYAYFFDNVWNFSSPTAVMSGSAIEGNGQIGVYQTGATYYWDGANQYGISSSPPVTFSFLVVAGINSYAQPTVTFEYNSGSGFQTYDTVTFDTVTFLRSFSGFVVSGFNYTPFNNFYDAEMIMGGPCCGRNTADVQSNVGLELYYSNGHNFETVPDAYNFGSDTAEGIGNVQSLWYYAFAGGTDYAEILPGAGSLRALYTQAETGIIDIRTSVPIGTLYVLNSSNPSEFAQYPFIGGEVTVDVYPGTYPLQIYQNGVLFDQATETVHAGEVLSLQTPFNDIQVTMSYSVVGGSGGFIPTLAYVNSGNQVVVGLRGAPTVYYMDPGTVWTVTYNATGNNERWITQQPISGMVTTAQTLQFTYYHQYLVTFSYTVLGGGSPSGPPAVQILVFGSTESTPVGAPVWVDAGSSYSATNPLLGSTSDERWETSGSSNAVNAGGTVSVLYYHQFPLALSYTLIGGGSPEAPAVSGTQLGSTVSVVVGSQGAVVWLDSGSSWTIMKELGGSGSQERWQSPSGSAGTVEGASSFSVSFYHQYALNLSYTIVGGGNPTGPSVSGGLFGAPSNVTLGEVSNFYYFDSGSSWALTNTLAGSSSAERWTMTQPDSGSVTGPSTMELTYYHQYYVTSNVTPAEGGTAANTAGWYTAGSTAQLSASANDGWQFEGWTGMGQGAYSGGLVQTSFQVNGPVSEDATFYPGLTITAGGNGAVGYSFGSQSGTVQGGTSQTVYASPGTIVNLDASASSIFFQFGGWTPSSVGSSGQGSVVLSSPYTAAASFSLNVFVIAGIVAAIVAVGASVFYFLRRGRGRVALPTAASPAQMVCPNCGAPINPSLAFCESCGAKLKQ
jgi:hypothetical protein